MSEFKLRRLGMLMEPEPGNPQEVEGVLNPAAVRGPDGELYLFPRLVAKGNYSRIGIARVQFNEAGDPAGVERLGIALEPEAEYELRPGGGGGCEDPRVTFVEPLKRYIMTYAAFSPHGPRIAMAESEDLFHWKRLGLATYAHWHGIELADVDDKDASLFPVAIPKLRRENWNWECSIVRFFPALGQRRLRASLDPVRWILNQESIWISYCPPVLKSRAPDRLGQFTSHHRLATPVSPWERLKIGAGTPPDPDKARLADRLPRRERSAGAGGDHHLCYSAGVMMLSKQHPRLIRYRSVEPVLTPVLAQERDGTVANVVFPTGIDRRDDLGTPDRLDVYYGMADSRIGVARLDLPEQIPAEAVADTPEAKV